MERDIRSGIAPPGRRTSTRSRFKNPAWMRRRGNSGGEARLSRSLKRSDDRADRTVSSGSPQAVRPRYNRDFGESVDCLLFGQCSGLAGKPCFRLKDRMELFAGLRGAENLILEHYGIEDWLDLLLPEPHTLLLSAHYLLRRQFRLCTSRHGTRSACLMTR